MQTLKLNKKSKRLLAIKHLAKERSVSLPVASHIYACKPRKWQKNLEAFVLDDISKSCTIYEKLK